MQLEFEAHYPSSDINVVAINQLRSNQNAGMPETSEVADLPILNDDAVSDIWSNWNVVYRDVRVIDSDGELAAEVMNLTQSGNDLGLTEAYTRMKGLILEAATKDRVALTPWQNRVEPLDVNNDGFIAPSDVLANVRRINDLGAGELGTPTEPVSQYFDVNGDGFIAPNDVLFQVIHLNRNRDAAGEPPEISSTEDQSVAPEAAPSTAVDAMFASFAANQVQEQHQDDDEDESGF